MSSFEKFVMDCDQLGMMQSMAAGVDLSENGLGLSAIREVGPGKHFLGCQHTQDNFETAFYRSNIADNNSYEQWLADGELRAEDRAKKVCTQMLNDYVAPDLDQGINEALKDFIKTRKDSMPDAFT